MFLLETAVLQIGTVPFLRYLTVCDGGLYICVARNSDGRVMHRNFSLTVGCEFG